jgi:hypothetical protein
MDQLAPNTTNTNGAANSAAKPFPFTTGESYLERRHPHITERLHLLWGFPEGGRYLAKLIIDSRGGRTGFSPEVMSELLVLATIAADMHIAQPERTSPFKVVAQRGQAVAGAVRRWGEHSLQPISFQLNGTGV